MPYHEWSNLLCISMIVAEFGNSIEGDLRGFIRVTQKSCEHDDGTVNSSRYYQPYQHTTQASPRPHDVILFLGGT